MPPIAIPLQPHSHISLVISDGQDSDLAIVLGRARRKDRRAVHHDLRSGFESHTLEDLVHGGG